MATLPYNSVARAIYLTLKDTHGMERTTMMHRVVDMLHRKRLLSKAPKILSELDKIINKEEGRVIAEVSSAKKLDTATKANLSDSIKKRYGARDVIIKEVINEELLGGFRVEIESEVVDLSTKHKIDTLQEHLTR